MNSLAFSKYSRLMALLASNTGGLNSGNLSICWSNVSLWGDFLDCEDLLDHEVWLIKCYPLSSWTKLLSFLFAKRAFLSARTSFFIFVRLGITAAGGNAPCTSLVGKMHWLGRAIALLAGSRSAMFRRRSRRSPALSGNRNRWLLGRRCNNRLLLNYFLRRF